MKHQLKPNTYTICESTEQCKELFEWAKANTDFDCTEDFYDEDIILFYGEDRIVAMRNSEACTDDGDTLVLLPEFISRLKGEWVEGKTYTQKEVIDLLVAERTRAVDACYEVYRDRKQSAESYKSAGNNLQYVIMSEVSDKARQLGNAISGRNGLTPDSETIKDRIERQLNNQ